VLVRYALALLALSLTAGSARPGDSPPAPIGLSCDSVVSVCPLDSETWIGCQAPCHDHFCLRSFIERHQGWYVQADALVLSHSSGRNRPLIVASDSGAAMLGTSDLNLGFQAGPRLLVGNRISPDRTWELSYFGPYDWNTLAEAEDPNNLDINGTLLGVAADYSGADWMALNYSSRMLNAEANLVRDRESWSMLAGLRYLHLSETMMLTASDSDSGTSDYTARSQTNLIGPQLGLRSGRLRDRWGYELTLKAGLLGAFTDQQQLLRDSDNTFLLRDGSADSFSVSFLGDFNLVGFLSLSDNWSLRIGYYAMYVAGTALATDQLDFENFATSGQRVLLGDLYLHGVGIGFEASW